MINKLFIIIIFSLFILIKPIQSAPINTCDIKTLELMLSNLGLDPTIRKNKDLITELNYKYGSSVSEYLYQEHPYLANAKDDILDNQTIEWAVDAIWNSDNKTMKYLPIMVDLDESKMNQYIIASYYELYASQDRVAFVFSTNAEYIQFMMYVKNNIFRILSEKFTNLTPFEIQKRANRYQDIYIKKGRYFIGFNSIPTKKARIIILGHGKEGVDGIKVADFPILSKDLIQRLILLNVPSDARLHLNSCHSACPANALNYTVKEIKYMFKNDLLKKIIQTGNDSFLSIFYQELYKEIPIFKGEVHGYIGRIMQTSQNNILNKEGIILLRSNAVKINGTDGVILLKKEDLRVSLPNQTNFINEGFTQI